MSMFLNRVNLCINRQLIFTTLNFRIFWIEPSDLEDLERNLKVISHFCPYSRLFKNILQIRTASKKSQLGQIQFFNVILNISSYIKPVNSSIFRMDNSSPNPTTNSETTNPECSRFYLQPIIWKGTIRKYTPKTCTSKYISCENLNL